MQTQKHFLQQTIDTVLQKANWIEFHGYSKGDAQTHKWTDGRTDIYINRGDRSIVLLILAR